MIRNVDELTPCSKLGLEGNKLYLIALNSIVKVSRATIHKTGPNVIIHYVPARKGHYIVKTMDILKP